MSCPVAPPNRRLTLGALSAASACALALGVAPAAPAGAGYHASTTWRGTHFLAFEGEAHNESGGTEYWSAFSLSETPIPIEWMTVCDYQGAIAIANPDGTHVKTNKTAFHSGCSMQGAFPSNATTGSYAENKRFTGRWISSSAQVGDQWRTIGTLVD